ncbi:hypothetical protein [Methylobacillus flagellatus]|uniref:hypothetical protein n=1 Tax=Methylobacillus flagellatus TaxID=405 RepID=UPI0010F987AF|nr:hypothetical protein [Methylobacillus flagellatus]
MKIKRFMSLAGLATLALISFTGCTIQPARVSYGGPPGVVYVEPAYRPPIVTFGYSYRPYYSPYYSPHYRSYSRPYYRDNWHPHSRGWDRHHRGGDHHHHGRGQGRGWR